MADLTRTYQGFAPRGRLNIDGHSLEFVRGVPVDVTDEQAALLDGDPDWAAPKKTPAKAAGAPTTKGSEPDHKEP